jgi:hypothetical protein
MALIVAAALAPALTPLSAQSKRATAAAPAATPTVVGAWMGTATVPLPDSAIVVPVLYTFTQSGPAIAGTAMVPGQGTGPISNVVQSGRSLKFRVTAPEGRLLEHDGAFAADGSIAGMVNLDKQPIASFKITMRPTAKPTTKPTAKPPEKPAAKPAKGAATASRP